MQCNCKHTEIVLGLLILIFALWQTAYSQWVVVISAVLLLIHAFWCKNSESCETSSTVTMKPRVAGKKKPASKKKR